MAIPKMKFVITWPCAVGIHQTEGRPEAREVHQGTSGSWKGITLCHENDSAVTDIMEYLRSTSCRI
jgi:hypothetical protein